MTGKDILDRVAAIIRRQDLAQDRDTLLFFVNSVRRAIFRDKPVKRFRDYRTGLPTVDGRVDMTATGLKSAAVVEWAQDRGDGQTAKVYLARLMSYKQAMEVFGTLSGVGEPQAYLEMGSSLQIIPVPLTGQINIYGEYWPADLTDSAASSDVTTREIPEALVYLAAAEYLDLLAEPEKAAYWRQKGLAIVDSYIRQLNRQEFDAYDFYKRRPFGLGSRKIRSVDYGGFTLDDLDMGEWT